MRANTQHDYLGSAARPVLESPAADSLTKPSRALQPVSSNLSGEGMPPHRETVETLCRRLQLLDRLHAGLAASVPEATRQSLLDRLLPLPVRPSHALRSLGSYVARAGQPLCIRLQFAQSPDQLQETLLHELAHACDHLTNQPGQRYRRAHGPGWQAWAKTLGIDPRRSGHCPELERLHRQRLKVVAICQRCGAEIRRTRRLPARRRYLHPECGGRIVALVNPL